MKRIFVPYHGRWNDRIPAALGFNTRLHIGRTWNCPAVQLEDYYKKHKPEDFYEICENLDIDYIGYYWSTKHVRIFFDGNSETYMKFKIRFEINHEISFDHEIEYLKNNLNEQQEILNFIHKGARTPIIQI